jgi:hypothetical protein
MLTALESAGMPFAIYPFSKDVETRRIGPFLVSRYDSHGVYDINVALMVTDQLPYYFSELKKQVKGGRHNILQTYWELAELRLPGALYWNGSTSCGCPILTSQTRSDRFSIEKSPWSRLVSASLVSIVVRGSILVWTTIGFTSSFLLITIRKLPKKILWEWL